MIVSNSKGILLVALALATILSIEQGGVNAFVPNDARVRIGGGESLLSAPSESLSFSALYYQKPPKESQQDSPRMSETDFRLDYVQGVRPPQKVLAKLDGPKKTNDDFVYGNDSTCYRGLTKPTQAGLVLALVLASGLVVASPEVHLPSVASLIENARYLMGDDAASELSTLIERIAFQWDMSGVETYMLGVSDQIALVYNNELLPLSSQLRDNFQEATMSISGQFDVFLSQIASEIDSIKHELSGSMASPEALMDQVLANGKEMLSQRSNELQLASQDTIEQFHQYVAQASSNLQAGVSEAWNKGTEFFAGNFANLPDASKLQLEQLDLNVAVPDTSELRERVTEELARNKDAVVLKSLEYKQASQVGMGSIQNEMQHTNEQLQGLANQYADDLKSAINMDDLHHRAQTEAVKYREMADSVVGPKYLEMQEQSRAKLTEIGQNTIQETENIQRRLIEVGRDFAQDSGRFLQQQIFAFQDSSVDTINKVKDQAFQGHASMDTISETLREWKTGVADAWSRAKNSIPGQFAIQDSLQNLKNSVNSVTEQLSVQDSLRDLKDGAASLANQVATQDIVQELKESANSITSQVSIQDSLQDLKDGVGSLTDQVSGVRAALDGLKDSATSITGHLSIENTLQDLKESTTTITNQISIQDTLQDLQESAGSITKQISIENTIHGLKDSTKSIANQAAVRDTLHDLRVSTTNALSDAGNTITNQVGTITPHPDPVSTESSYLKSVLEDVVY